MCKVSFGPLRVTANVRRMNDPENNMEKKVALNSLRPVSILFNGDFYELANLIIKISEEMHQGTNIKSRPTLHGVAAVYSWLVIDIDSSHIEQVLEEHGLDLGATVECDDDIV